MRNIEESQKDFQDRYTNIVKDIESIALNDAKNEDKKRENGNINGDSAMGTMLQFGSTVGREFTKSYLMNPLYSKLHDEGLIHIHDMDFYPEGTTTCMQIDLEKLFKEGFNTGHGYLRTPNDIMSYGALTAIAIQANQNDQHGGQSIPFLDYYLAPGVLKTFKKQYKQTYVDMADALGINEDEIHSVITYINSLNSLKEAKENSVKLTDNILVMAYDKALQKTERITYQAMEALVHNLNTLHSRAGAQVPFSSVNFGTDISDEGRMVVRSFLLATDKGLGKGETPIFPISIFRVKEGVNYNPTDPNYDLFKLACKVSAKRLFPNFVFQDAPFNMQYYNPNDYRTEIATMGCRTRVMGNVCGESTTPGRGNLSFTTINLVRLGIEHGLVSGTVQKPDLEGFYKDLFTLMDIVKEQLLERYRWQCQKHKYNFPFLINEGVWYGGERLNNDDQLDNVLKTGTLSIGFIGLAECLVALTGYHHGENNESYKLGYDIVKEMRVRCDYYCKQYGLNFSLLATPAEGLSGRFTRIDAKKYGKIIGVTDRDYYTNSFHIPVYYNISVTDKIQLEAPFHELTNAGHITYIELDGDTCKNVDAFESVIRTMKEAGIGYGAINHPVDRDPVCGFNGIIDDVCPQCGRSEGSHKFERIRRITGYLVGTLDRFNDGKRAEEHDRVKHNLKDKEEN